VNPIDWIAWIYGKFFADHPILGGFVFCFGASAIMLLLQSTSITTTIHRLELCGCRHRKQTC
jgi:hypothetical protein